MIYQAIKSQASTAYKLSWSWRIRGIKDVLWFLQSSLLVTVIQHCGLFGLPKRRSSSPTDQHPAGGPLSKLSSSSSTRGTSTHQPSGNLQFSFPILSTDKDFTRKSDRGFSWCTAVIDSSLTPTGPCLNQPEHCSYKKNEA